MLGFIVFGDSQNGQVDLSVEKTPVPLGSIAVGEGKRKALLRSQGFIFPKVGHLNKEMRGCSINKRT